MLNGEVITIVHHESELKSGKIERNKFPEKQIPKP